MAIVIASCEDPYVGAAWAIAEMGPFYLIFVNWSDYDDGRMPITYYLVDSYLVDEDSALSWSHENVHDRGAISSPLSWDQILAGEIDIFMMELVL